MLTMLKKRASWLRAIEANIGHLFVDLGSTVPFSAALATNVGEAVTELAPVRATERIVPTTKLGEQLIREKRMGQIKLPFDKMRLAMTETDNPAKTRSRHIRHTHGVS